MDPKLRTALDLLVTRYKAKEVQRPFFDFYNCLDISFTNLSTKGRNAETLRPELYSNSEVFPTHQFIHIAESKKHDSSIEIARELSHEVTHVEQYIRYFKFDENLAPESDREVEAQYNTAQFYLRYMSPVERLESGLFYFDDTNDLKFDLEAKLYCWTKDDIHCYRDKFIQLLRKNQDF